MSVTAMLACSTVLPIRSLKLPLFASFKLDGIRAIAWHGVAMSRNGKPIPNAYVQSFFKAMNLHGLDGEIMLNDSTKDFNDVQSEIMRSWGSPDFAYHIFDHIEGLNDPFERRLTTKTTEVLRLSNLSERIKNVVNVRVTNYEYLERLYADALQRGFEGLITRSPDSPYKQGRSTQKQQWMMKLKPVHDAEGEIIGFQELEHNLDTSTKRQENMVGGGTLGAFLVKWNGVEFAVGTGKGMTQKRRQEWWDNRENILGGKLTFSFQELSSYGVPRFPRVKGLRYE